ncbi:hypothetical protein FKM82_029555 [Ascaphus truei]
MSGSPSQAPENRLPFLASRMSYPVPSSYHFKSSYIPPAASTLQPSLEVIRPGPRVQYSNLFPKTNPPCAGTQNPGSAPSANKENGEAAGLDLKYLKKRNGVFPLRGLNHNLASGTGRAREGLSLPL